MTSATQTPPPPDSLMPDEERAHITNAADKADRTLVIGCGALAREMVHLVRRSNGIEPIDIACLPATWHNRPDRIPDGVARKIQEARAAGYGRVLVAYGDCGTGGMLDAVLEKHGVERIGGPHCYAFYAGDAAFDRLMEEEIGSFFLTDYLVRHFDTLIMKGMGIDVHPELRAMYFERYARLVYLAQTEDPALQDKAKAAAAKLGLAYTYRFTGYGELSTFMPSAAS